MNWKKLGKTLIYPHIAVMIILIPVSVLFLIYTLLHLGTESALAIVSYVLAFYTLSVWCLKIPVLIKFFKRIQKENKYAKIWLDDTALRMNVSLYGSLIWNTAYAVFQLFLGIEHHTFWFFSLSGYYFALAVMRFFLVWYTSCHKAGENMIDELRRYRACGIVFLVMNLALALIVFFMVYWNRTFVHHEITTITMAAYTFGSLTIAIVNVCRYRRYNSPVYSASKAISLAAACVSVLTLESTMLTTFGKDSVDALSRKVLLGFTGGAVSIFIIAMAMFMIISATKKIKLLIDTEE